MQQTVASLFFIAFFYLLSAGFLRLSLLRLRLFDTDIRYVYVRSFESHNVVSRFVLVCQQAEIVDSEPSFVMLQPESANAATTIIDNIRIIATVLFAFIILLY